MQKGPRRKRGPSFLTPYPPDKNRCEKMKYSEPESRIDTGTASTQAIAMLRMVASCSPEPLAAMAPATPDDSTWVVETGRPNMSAAPMGAAATSSADAAWA